MNEHKLEATDCALICEGGGMRSMYAAALMTRLIHENVHFGWAGGSSSGAVNIANFLSGDVDRIQHGADTYAPEGPREKALVMVQRLGVFRYDNFDETSVFDPDYPFNFHAFASNDTPVRVGAVRADTGQTVWWDRSDMRDKISLLKRLEATTSMPTIRPETYIDGVPYIDGMFANDGGLPIERALADGMEKFFVILTRPRTYWKRPFPQPWMIRQSLHRFPIIAEVIVKRAAHYNAAKQRLLELETAGQAYLFFPDDLPKTRKELAGKTPEYYFNRGLAQTQREWPLMREFLTN